MNKTIMLKKNYEFRRVLSKGIYFGGIYIQAVILKNKKNYNSLGLAINTKSGKAFKRNRTKRLLRENYKLIEGKLQTGLEIVFLLKKKTNIDDLNFQNIGRDMEKIAENSGILIK